MEGAEGSFHLGCAVWSYPDWVGPFYPPGTKSGDMLALYGQRLRAVEGNTTFYATPAPETLEKWAAALPEGFLFLPKLSREITHAAGLAPGLGMAQRFVERMDHLGDRRGPIFAQLPPTYGPRMMGDLEEFLQGWRDVRWPLLLEVRHPQWFDPEPAEALDAMLHRHAASRVILDTRPCYRSHGPSPMNEAERKKPDLPVRLSLTHRIIMIRYIAHPDGDLNQVWLDAWGQRIKTWVEAGHQVLFFCHCPQEVQSPSVAKRFQATLEAMGAPIPALPWNDLPPAPRQLDLFS